MLLTNFLKEIEGYNLPFSQVLDLLSFALNISYDEAKIAFSKKDISLKDEIAGTLLSKLSQKIPIAYITGKREFYGLLFNIDESCLIPRVETEILVEYALNFANKSKKLQILDVCSGSGAIALSLLHYLPTSDATLIDISSEALKISKKTAKELNCLERADFIEDNIIACKNQLDIFKEIDRRFDIITCNPPYIKLEEYKLLEDWVKKEPINALVAFDSADKPSSPTLFYKHIFNYLKDILIPGGAAFFEITTLISKRLSRYAASIGLKSEIYNDYNGIKRVMKIWI